MVKGVLSKMTHVEMFSLNFFSLSITMIVLMQSSPSKCILVSSSVHCSVFGVFAPLLVHIHAYIHTHIHTHTDLSILVGTHLSGQLVGTWTSHSSCGDLGKASTCGYLQIFWYFPLKFGSFFVLYYLIPLLSTYSFGLCTMSGFWENLRWVPTSTAKYHTLSIE